MPTPWLFPQWQVFSYAFGRNYYFDASGGNDSYNGLTPATAWQTVAKHNATSFAPDDQVLWKRGETFPNALRPPNSGTSGHYITYGAYGSGAKPIITINAVVVYLSNLSWLKFDNLNLISTDTTHNVIQLGSASTSAHDCVFSNIDISGGLDGIDIEGVGGVYNLTFTNITVNGTHASGVMCQGDANDSTHDIVFDTVTVHNCGTSTSYDHGFYINWGCKNVTLTRCVTYSNATWGIALKCHDSLVERCAVYSNGGGGMDFNTVSGNSKDCTNNILRNNLVYNNTGWGFMVNNQNNLPESGNCFYNNTFVNNTLGGIDFESNSTVGMILRNNLVLQNSSVVGGTNRYCLRLNSATIIPNNTFDYNDWIYVGSTEPFYVAGSGSKTLTAWKALTGSPDVHSISSNPIFITNYTDLHLTYGSPCIGAGDNTLGITTDGDGYTRGATNDIGCFQYQVLPTNVTFIQRWNTVVGWGAFDNLQERSSHALSNITLVNSPLRYGVHSAKIHVEYDIGKSIGQGDCRAEGAIMHTPLGADIFENENSGTVYYGFSVQLVSPYDTSSYGRVFQIHGPDAYGVGPTAALEVRAGYRFWSVVGELPKTGILYTLSPDTIYTNQWSDFMIMITFSRTVGEVHILRREEGETVWTSALDITGVPTVQWATGDSPPIEHYWKSGMLRNNILATNELYISQVVRGSTFSDVELAAFGTSIGAP